MELTLRPLTRDDVAAVNEIAAAQGRNLHERELGRFIELEGAQGYVAVRDGVLVGAITAIRYFEHAFLGPLVLRDGPDAVGLAVALTVATVEALQRDGVGLIEAEASGSEIDLLRRMGFRTLRRTILLERRPEKVDVSVRTVPLEPAHFLDLGALDASAVGWGRKEWLWALRDEAPQGARAVEDAEGLRGFVLLRRSRRGYHLGPLVTAAGDEATARMLLADAVAAAASWPIVALVAESSALLPALAAAGFEEVGELHRMRAGPETPLGDSGATEWIVGGRLTG